MGFLGFWKNYRELVLFTIFRLPFENVVYVQLFVCHNLYNFIPPTGKKPKNYPLQNNKIIKFLKAYKKLNLSYCCIDNGKIIRVISNGIDYIKINKGYHDKRYLFDAHKQEYEYIGNDWYVKRM